MQTLRIPNLEQAFDEFEQKINKNADNPLSDHPAYNRTNATWISKLTQYIEFYVVSNNPRLLD